MTTTPETTTTVDTDKPHVFLAGLAQQGGYAFRFAKAGQTTEAHEHTDAIERLIAAYRTALGSTDTLAAWLYQRFNQSDTKWIDLTSEDQSYWEHHAAAVRRAVLRGGFKDGERTE